MLPRPYFHFCQREMICCVYNKRKAYRISAKGACMQTVIRILLAVMVVLMVNALPAHAARGGHGHGHGGGRVGVGVYVGPGWWGPGWWGPYPYYPPRVIVEQPPEIYVQPPQSEEPRYWYYCPDPQGYYPEVKRCPKGWMKVVPPADVTPEEEE